MKKLIILLLICLVSINVEAGKIHMRIGDQNSIAPYQYDMPFLLDGTIIQIGGNYYFKDRTKNNRHFLITGYDFPTDWTYGLPYKSAATISAPANDFELWAYDVDSFLYDGNHTPRQIPVISLFQNIDYANRLFCKHESQVLDVNGVETYEPRVSQIVLYRTVKTSTQLTNCNSHFGVPVADASAKYVDAVNGDDGYAGTISSPYKTITKGNTEATTIVYVKTGNYNFSGAQKTFTKNITSIGYSRCYNYGSAYALTYGASGKTFKGFIIDGNNSSTGGITTGVYANTFDRCYIFNNTSIGIRTSTSNITISNCIIKGTTYCIYVASANTLTIIGNCIVGAMNTQGIRFVSNGTNLISNYNKFSGAFSNVYNSLTTIYNNTVSLLNNKGTFTCTNYYYSGYDKGISVSYDNISSNGAFFFHGSSSGITNEIVNILNCKISSSLNSGYVINVKEKHCNISNNIITITGTAYPLSVNSVTNNGLNWLVSNNIIDVNVNDGKSPAFGDPNFVYHNMGVLTFSKNLVRGPLFFDKTAASQSHGVCVWWNKDADISYNKIEGYEMPLVLKANAEDYANVKVYANIFIDGRVIVKGISNTKIINNTFYNSNFTTCNLSLNDELGNHSLGTVIKNNIFYNSTSTQSNILVNSTEETYTSNTNLFYSPNGYIADITGGTRNMNFTTWQGLGNDANSINQNPFLNSETNLWPNTVFLIGEDLGSPYNIGLDTTTTWGSTTTIPVIVTKNQPAIWQIGAYVQ